MVTEETVLGEELLWGIDSVWGECGGCVWAGVGDGGVRAEVVWVGGDLVVR